MLLDIIKKIRIELCLRKMEKLDSKILSSGEIISPNELQQLNKKLEEISAKIKKIKTI